jgi:hypothetical protein
MPAVVTFASKVLCGPPMPASHGGTVTTVVAPKLTVDGSPVVLNVVSPIAGCLTPTVTSTPPSNPCTLVSTVNPTSLATKLFVSGQPVVLATLSGATNGVIAGVAQTALEAVVTQTHLTAV